MRRMRVLSDTMRRLNWPTRLSKIRILLRTSSRLAMNWAWELKILTTRDVSCKYCASPRIWNQLPASFRQPRTNLSNSDSATPTSGTSFVGSIDWPLSWSIHPSTLSFPAYNLSFLQILPSIAFFFLFRTDSADFWAYLFYFTFLKNF